MKILIAEDDETSRLLLETTLSRWGHEVVSTKDGQQAYNALLEKDGPKLAILDWMMPYLDGVEICRKARLESTIQHLYIVMLTTRNTVDDITEALDSGADDYLNKPFDRKELRANRGRISHHQSTDDPGRSRARVRRVNPARGTPSGPTADMLLL